MRKKREFVEGAFYHVTSRTNDKIRIFENKLGRKIMLMVLQDAKNYFGFSLANFCVMPTHIHLLIKPHKGTNLSEIMRWIKTKSAKRWNKVHGSSDHVWGHRFFDRVIKDDLEFDYVMNYIDQNPVVAELSTTPEEWKPSGAYFKANKILGLIDFLTNNEQTTKLLSPIPPLVSRLLPPEQLRKTTQYFGAYVEDVENIYKTIPDIPKIGETDYNSNPTFYLHYSTGTADYFICEYDGEDTMFGKVRFSVFPEEEKFQKISLEKLKGNTLMTLDFGWKVTGTFEG